MNQSVTAKKVLRTSRLKVTPARVAILGVLSFSKKPLSVDDILSRLKGVKVNQVTVYRTLSSLEKSKIVRLIDLRAGIKYYELSNHHHHHIVCKVCGDLEDFDFCVPEEILSSVRCRSKKFLLIEDHSFELFGKCKKCTK